MLRKLIIQNYAIINEINIHFSEKLNIITGETGAGKSILMGALSLILGERADSTVLVNNQQKCFIEGYFSNDNKAAVLDFLKEHDIDIEEELILRREIGVNGKSRAFINDSPASLIQLKQLAGMLVDLHQQFDTLELGDSDFQRQVIDALAGNVESVQSFRILYLKWQAINKELTNLKSQKADFIKEADYHQFLFGEIDDLNLSENELEVLEEELKMLNNAENIKNGLEKINAALNNADQPIVGQLKQLLQQLTPFQEFHQSIPELCSRLKAAHVELHDIADELEHINGNIHFDEKRIEWINQRLNDGFKLLKKHSVKTTTALIAVKNELAIKLEKVLHLDDLIISLEKEANEILLIAETEAKKISTARAKTIPDFEKKVNGLLKQVGMPNAKIQVKLVSTHLHEFGLETIELLFDANNTNKFESIKKVASGGELSRLMLCIKSLVAEYINLPTLIFDEIDTGISGEAAKQVGQIMQKMTNNRQIICITHQPQIAGKADAHFYVYKEFKNEQMQTTIRLLQEDERIDAIAKMLSGEKPTAAAIENAREMIR
ncbi:MAG: DNA repair protein RecN [Sphingobacteriia bacterium]|nr:MAG: DNA repair protein RecN [Sphingobacteriia bacterium]